MLQKDVVIVGAGMVGLSLALALYNKGLQVVIIEAGKIPFGKLSANRIETRVSAINHNSQNFLKELDVWDSIKEERVSPYYTMRVWDDTPDEYINITAEEISEHNLGHIVENQLIVDSLLSKIKSTDIQILENSKISEVQRYKDIVRVKLNDLDIEANLLVGADGANSFIRDYFNFSIKVKAYDHTAIVATLELEKSHEATAYQRFYDKGVLAFLPLEDQKRASIVWSLKSEYASHINSLNDREFEEELSKAINGTLGEVKLLSKRFSFPLAERHAKEYIQDRVVLVGDACHTIHPLAGQGINLGFKDVQVLVDVLSEAFEKGRILGALSTLDKYQRQRKLDNTKMIYLMKAFKEVFASNNNVISSLRKFGLNFVNKNSLVKKTIVKQAL